MGKLGKGKEAPLAMPDTPGEDFNLTINELTEIQFHCNVLKDLADLSMEEGRKLHKNNQQIKAVITPLREGEGTLLDDKRKSINEAARSGRPAEELTKMQNEWEAGNKDFYSKKHEVRLYPVPETAFPRDRKLFPKKQMSINGNPIEVETYASYLELLDTIIKED